MAISSSTAKSPAPEINVTPLVDVVLVLLIIFMVVVPMLSKEILVQLPEKAKASDDVSEVNIDPPYVVVHANTTIEIDAKPVSLKDVAGVIRSRLNRERTVRFKSEDDAPYALVVDVLDTVKGAGGTNVTVETLKTAAP